MVVRGSVSICSWHTLALTHAHTLAGGGEVCGLPVERKAVDDNYRGVARAAQTPQKLQGAKRTFE